MADDQMKAPLVANFSGTPRIQWTPPLHERFLSAVTELGGPYEAKPKAILKKMGVEGLNLRHIKSHLQKYRITIGGVRHMDDSRNSEQTENEFPEAPIANNFPPPQKIPVAHDMGSCRIYNVPGVQTTREGISNAPYDIRGLGVYGIPELSARTEETPNMLPNSYDTGSQDAYASLQVRIRTEMNPCLVPAPQIVGSHEVYDIPGLQTATEGIVEQERYSNRFTDVRYINHARNQPEASNPTMDYSNNTPSLPTWETTYTTGDQEIYNQSTMLQRIKGGEVQEEYQYHGGSLNSGNNNKGKGIMGLPPHNVVANHLDFPTSNTPSFATMSTPSRMGGYEVYDGSSIHKEMEGGVKQGNKLKQVEKHIMIREDAYMKYMDSMIKKACKFVPSSETQSACQSHK